ncbi:MAG: PAS domain S-box protein [Desulfohalobiaceae bacterium]|nr:PAS domain S-box protein [Desulfohalobiaceae bacterium]
MLTATKYTEAEENLRFKDLYDILFDSIPSSVLILNRNTKVVAANKQFLHKSLRTAEDTVGLNLSDIIPRVILESVQLPKEIQTVFSSKAPTSGRMLKYRAPGLPTRFYYYRIVPFCWKRKVELVLFLMDDITEQVHLNQEVRRIESHLAGVVESTSELILSTDMQARIVSWNRAAEELTGYSFEEVRGRFLYNFFIAEDRVKARHMFVSTRYADWPNLAEWRFQTKQNNSLLIAWAFSLMKDKDNGQSGVVALGRDMTEWRKMERQLSQAHKFASLGVMAGGIAHEIRNPLAISSSAAQFLLEEDLDPTFRRECAQKISSGLERASKVIENLLSFAHPGARIGVEEVDLPALIKDSLELVFNEAKIQKIRTFFSSPRNPVFISGNRDLLQQVLINILINGIRAMPEGGDLRIAVEANGSECTIKISDTGGGIAEKDRENIFDPFYTTSPAGQGTGLGLSVAYSIVKQHSGEIEVDSAEGRGTVFSLRFPLH